MDVDRVPDAKERARKVRMITRRAKVKMPKEKERNEKENGRKDRKVIRRAKVSAKTRKGKHLRDARYSWSTTSQCISTE